eukprot:COSAG02_NODE_51394_length_314_cov_0.948837_1_plen_45_part_10
MRGVRGTVTSVTHVRSYCCSRVLWHCDRRYRYDSATEYYMDRVPY